MAKEKVSEQEIKNKEFVFLYEVIGVICILIALISVFRLGILGLYGMLAFRLLFGDWYFLFIALLGALGVYFLFMHHHFELNSIRYVGIILVLVALIILSHFSMHKFVSKFEGNSFTTTISLYFDYFKNSRNDMMIGGGIIGCILFYIFYYLLSSVGTILVCLILIFVGIVFITKKTIIDFFKMFKNIFKKCFGGAFSITKKIKKKVKLYNSEYKKEEVGRKKLKSKFLDNIVINQDIEYNVAKGYLDTIKKILDHLNIFYQDVSFIVCYHITAFFISTFQVVNYEVLRLTIEKHIHKNVLIRFDELNHIIVVEVNNEKPLYLNMREAIKLGSKDKQTIVLGIDDRNQLVTTNESILVVSSLNVNYKYYFSSILIYLLLKKDLNDIEIIVIDLNNNFSIFKNVVDLYYDNISSLIELKKELEEVLVVLDDSGVSKIDEYNKVHKQKLKKRVIYFNGVENIINNFEYNKYLEFFVLSGSNIGYQFILASLDNIGENNIILRSLNYKLFLENNFSLSEKYFGGGIFSKINKNIEGMLKYKDLSIRMSLLKVSKEELEKLLNLKKK